MALPQLYAPYSFPGEICCGNPQRRHDFNITRINESVPDPILQSYCNASFCRAMLSSVFDMDKFVVDIITVHCIYTQIWDLLAYLGTWRVGTARHATSHGRGLRLTKRQNTCELRRDIRVEAFRPSYHANKLQILRSKIAWAANLPTFPHLLLQPYVSSL